MIPADILISAYAHGWFPMAGEDGLVRWYSPDPRGIIPLDGVHVPARLARVVRNRRFEIRVNTAFPDVIRACAEVPRDPADPGSWISDEIVDAYVALHERGVAHSVEAWREGVLAGGLYGVALGGVFFGESMFHRATDASKVALVALVERLRERGYRLLDTQWTTGHLEQFGAVEIPRRRYLELLEESLRLPCRFVDRT
ncbi:MAG TPA: leucyl/phenylalanyl-tRNA--protein transferase [Vicinamibacterales bacterium]|nr:leucyl/phenylalanyl-tRNA--protein transferase [Vicinamibacterales bacterium]